MTAKNLVVTPSHQILRWPEVQKLTGICRSHAHALVAKGQFPPPIKLGPRASGWIECEIHDWIQSRIDESRGNAA